MTEFRSKFFFSEFSFFIVRKNEVFFLLLLLMTTLFEKCITIASPLLFSTILWEIKFFFFCTSVSFENFRSMLMLNNAKIQWNEELIEMCETTNVILIWLFSYFFNFNLIKTLFVLLKTWIKKNKKQTELFDNFEKFLKSAIKEQTNVKNSKNLFRLIDIVGTIRNSII